jgi:hypothetical protein
MILILSGLACLGLGSAVVYSIVKQQAVGPSAWTSTETRSTATALGIVFLVVFGLGLVLKGILS